MDKDVIWKKLMEIAEEAPFVFDDMIHDIFSAKASAINNQGPADQIEFLLLEGGFKDTEALLKFVK